MRFADILDMTCALCPIEGRSTVEARVKQWQRMGFPEGVNIGRGKKADYSQADAEQIAIVCQLQRIGYPPGTAIPLVVSRQYTVTANSIIVNPTPWAEIHLDAAPIRKALRAAIAQNTPNPNNGEQQ